MRIVDRTTFLGLPAGTVYQKCMRHEGEIVHGIFSGISIKIHCFENDWVLITPEPDPLTSEAGGIDVAATTEALQKGSLPISFDGERDGCFDANELFLVWDSDDVQRWIERLSEATTELNDQGANT